MLVPILLGILQSCKQTFLSDELTGQGFAKFVQDIFCPARNSDLGGPFLANGTKQPLQFGESSFFIQQLENRLATGHISTNAPKR
ncbi:hypothetical protein FTUN_6267 [Frigoriglobus tundricola]|uniref:Uncharacterized protein n=1 Tax=Frigoriglobus tundricola TaxID=2774151 RepID=A0A6M5Z0E3_9BACT|nr:hypothetical protein FTUN_6267 [Frigoriglobus tundricola]